jgi:hypothetical protein
MSNVSDIYDVPGLPHKSLQRKAVQAQHQWQLNQFRTFQAGVSGRIYHNPTPNNFVSARILLPNFQEIRLQNVRNK